MKLDKIKFASLIGFITYRCGMTITQDDMREIDELIDIDMPEQQAVYPLASDVEQLMALMHQGTQKIEAIKLHRKIAGYGLKESKDAVERYWPQKLTQNIVASKLMENFTISEDRALDIADQIIGMQK